MKKTIRIYEQKIERNLKKTILKYTGLRTVLPPAKRGYMDVLYGIYHRAESCEKMEDFRPAGAEILRGRPDRWDPQIWKIVGNSVQRGETTGPAKGKGAPVFPAFPIAAGSLSGIYAADEHAF